MKLLVSHLIVIPQIIAAFIVGLCYYMLAMVMTAYDGFISLILQPIMGTIVTLLAIIILLGAGLPIRLLKQVNQWWRLHWWISFILGALAFAMMGASWLPCFRIRVFDPEIMLPVESFHPVLAIGGWLLTLFAVLHFYPPLPWHKSQEHERQR